MKEYKNQKLHNALDLLEGALTYKDQTDGFRLLAEVLCEALESSRSNPSLNHDHKIWEIIEEIETRASYLASLVKGHSKNSLLIREVKEGETRRLVIQNVPLEEKAVQLLRDHCDDFLAGHPFDDSRNRVQSNRLIDKMKKRWNGREYVTGKV